MPKRLQNLFPGRIVDPPSRILEEANLLPQATKQLVDGSQVEEVAQLECCLQGGLHSSPVQSHVVLQ